MSGSLIESLRERLNLKPQPHTVDECVRTAKQFVSGFGVVEMPLGEQIRGGPDATEYLTFESV